MNKIIKIIFLCIAAIVVCYSIYFFFGIIRNSHSANWQIYKQYMWLFKDSIRSDVDTTFSFSYVKERDVYNNFHYKGSEYNIIIWEFKDLSKAELKDSPIIKNVNLDNIECKSGEILNKNSDLEIVIKHGFVFNHTINVNLGKESKIEKNLKGANYKGFLGLVNKMSLSNENNKHQIILNYTEGLTPTVFLLYKGHKSFYLIIINSKEPINENIISILNL